MVQAARISITGTQSMEDAEPQTLKLVTDGSYCYEPGFALLSYVESEMTGLEGVVTSFQIEDGKTVTLRRSGKVNAEMVFDRRQAHELPIRRRLRRDDDQRRDGGYDRSAQRTRRCARSGLPCGGRACALQPEPLSY